jgi:hypothetical protein
VSYIKRHDENARDAALYPWLKRAHALIERRLADARAHSETGRPDLARERLGEIQQELLWAADSASGLIRDARASFFRQAIAHHERFLDPAAIDPDFPVTSFIDGEHAVRTVTAGGRHEWNQLGALLAEARTSLPVQGLADDLRVLAHAGWENRHREAIQGWTRAVLSDSQIVIHNVVGHLMLRPELRDHESTPAVASPA